MFDPARLVFIDETGANTKTVRLRGRCHRSERLIGSVPHGHWKTISLVAGLRHEGIVAPFVIDGPINGRVFLTYIEQCLAPTLDRGDIVIMDNLRTHKMAGVMEAIEVRMRRHFFSLHILQISTRSNKSSANSKRFCAKPQSEQFQAFGEESAPSCAPSARRDA
jgi:hypothetical protein